ncbi:MAG: right-handed parallel beta-helix repeat-containing protein [Crocinitomicaceae bacterium]|nr:right-handed parallel beta-helix repeat-containing protein [Crocinitomicaceae bacterium]MCF8410400.1 right-handed parallel beta-helix repeat-containing protein [Crocinitomicaceae bacterium]
MVKPISILFFIVAVSLSIVSCKKNNLLSKKNLSFSVDTLVFDTVFTTIGSTTKQFKIYNKESKTVQIDEIELVGGESSPFRMNVDGLMGTKMTNIKLEGKDSLFVFVEVTLDINSQTLPLIIEDSIRFRTNGKDQYVKLAVWGQDAYFHYKDLNEGTWPNDKPHVIYGYAAVDSAKTLNIQAGTQVHLHKNAIFYVYKSTLNVQGTIGNEVVFQGDRLEQDYQDISGQYYGIYFQEARPSTIDYAIIKNGTSGVHLFSEDPTNTGYTLTMTNTIIQNQARYGVFIYSGAKVKAENCIISKNGTHALLVLEGGDFNFNHCDLLGYGASPNPAVGISNFFTNYQTATTNVGSINEGVLYNCVVSGSLATEMAIDTIQLAGVTLNFDFKNCLIKSETIQTDSFYQSIIWNNNPLFTDPSIYDFSFLVNSPLNGNGFATSVITDVFGNPRNNPPDIGAIELN